MSIFNRCGFLVTVILTFSYAFSCLYVWVDGLGSDPQLICKIPLVVDLLKCHPLLNKIHYLVNYSSVKLCSSTSWLTILTFRV